MPQLTLFQIFCIFLKLGCTSFGGPIAHLGFFREEFVQKRRWLDDTAYAELVALCQFLPGPASSQLGMALGFMQSRVAGAVAAWLGFTLPSALLLVLLAYAVGQGFMITPWMAGLKIVAVAVVAQALWGMTRSLVHSIPQFLLLLVAAILSLSMTNVLLQITIITGAAVIGYWTHRDNKPPVVNAVKMEVNNTAITDDSLTSSFRASHSMSFGIAFVILLFTLPLLADHSAGWLIIDSFYRAGALVFGGGHVVLPLLEAELVNVGVVSKEEFVAAYGAAQAVPGPLFTVASYLGFAAGGSSPLFGALLATLAIFLPGFLLVIAFLPWWQFLRTSSAAQRALAGVNAAVVGILFAAWYDPVLTSAIINWQTTIAALLATAFLIYGRQPAWRLVVIMLVISPWLST
jgi:chromate transporter